MDDMYFVFYENEWKLEKDKPEISEFNICAHIDFVNNSAFEVDIYIDEVIFPVNTIYEMNKYCDYKKNHPEFYNHIAYYSFEKFKYSLNSHYLKKLFFGLYLLSMKINFIPTKLKVKFVLVDDENIVCIIPSKVK